MEDDGEGQDTPVPPDAAENSGQDPEVSDLLKGGPRSGNRSAGMAFLALMVLLGAALHYHLASSGGESFGARLESELLTHAELSLASMENDGSLVVVPSWPLRLYANIRRDIAVYSVMLAAAVFLWGLSVRARARRDAFLVHERLSAEVGELRNRLARLENGREDSRTPDKQ